MGCGSFLCDGCRGRDCNQNGGQNGDCKAIIEVPLSDNTTVYLKGDYCDDERSVNVKLGDDNYEFYATQWKEYFECWFSDEPAKYRKYKFLGGKVYTYSYKEYVEDDDSDDEYQEKTVTRRCECQPYGTKIVELTKEILAKCIRADHDMNLPDEEEELKQNIEKTKKKIQELEKQLKEEEENLRNLQPLPMKRKIRL